MTRLGLIAALLLVLLGARDALADKRVALVIGNGAYANTPHLANPPNDAADMAAVLQRISFEVIALTDADYGAMRRGVRKFIERVRGADVGLVFYAGHGLQVDGRNWLLPVSAKLQAKSDLVFEAFDLQTVLQLMDGAGVRVKFVLLDACRDNPLTRSFARALGAGRGLAEPSATTVGTLIAFATAPGDVAADGSGRNSPFTAALLHHLPEPGVEVRTLFARVRESVLQATNEQQLPWVNEAVRGEFYFVPKADAAIATAPPTTPPESPPASEVSVEMLFWQSVQGSDDPADYDDYIAQYPEGHFIRLAKRRRDDLREQQQATRTPPQQQPPQQRLELEPIERAYVALKNANVRGEPNVGATRVTTLARGTRVHVAGKVKGRDWYLVERDGERLGFVFAALLRDAAAEPPATASGTGTQQARLTPAGKATACDRLAAHPYDPRRVADGVVFDSIDAEAAMAACRTAVRAQPDEARLQYQYGRALLRGGKFAEARGWFRKAASEGYAMAHYNLGLIYKDGRGVQKDNARTAAWFRKGAEQGLAVAEAGLGTMYVLGEGVTQDYAEALRWYRKAAAQGVAGAQAALGMHYEEGLGVEVDLAEAVAWHRKAAAQGFAPSEYRLGWAYEYGQGVQQDRAEAIKWYSLAAKQGFDLAQDSLRRLQNQ